MAAPEERLKILQMLEEGKISAEEAAALLRALEGGQRPPPPPVDRSRFLRVQVTDLESGSAKVNVTIPVGLVSVALRMAERFAPETQNIDLQELAEIIASGTLGKVVEVADAEENERVEIYVE